MIWKFREQPSEEKIRTLGKLLSEKRAISPILASIFLQRGIDSYEKAKDFFVPSPQGLHDPYLLKDMDKSVKRLVELRNKKEHITLLGDYDVDGTTAVAMVGRFLDHWDISWSFYIPDRYNEGYGISYKGIEFAQAKGAKVVMSLDCGIKAVDKIAFAAQRGMEVIVCDHHQPGPVLPNAFSILNPQQTGCVYPFKDLSGCGVAFKLITALQEAFRLQEPEHHAAQLSVLDAFCDMVVLSIACDVVPIENENRILAYHGLQKLRTQPSEGLQAIMQLSERERVWDISDLLFFIGPQINAAGRLQHAKYAVEILLGNAHPERVLQLFQTNDNRKEIDRRMTQEALGMIHSDKAFQEKSTTALFHPDWHHGVIGIVASRLIEHHYRPTILLTQSDLKGQLVGSARSVKGFDLYTALEQCKDLLIRFGGHKYAAGLTMKETALPDFCNKFEKIVAESILPEHKNPVLLIDHLIRFKEINLSFIRTLNRMAPFGPGNPKPVLVAEVVEITDATILKENHVKLRLRQEGVCFDAIGFNLASVYTSLTRSTVDIAFQPSIDTWNEQTKIKLRIKDIRSAY